MRKVTSELIKKAQAAFASAEKGTILTGEGLSRGELRALERKNLVEKLPTRKVSKYIGQSGALMYAWRWIGGE